MKTPFASVIIVNFNGKEHLHDCFTSLAAQSYSLKNFEVILVDNNSNDTSVRYTKTHFPWVKVVESKVNLGFSAGCNLGVTHARGEYLVFLNNDTTVAKDWLGALVKRAQSDPTIAAVNSKTLLYYPFIELAIHSDTFNRSEFSKTSNVQLVGVLIEELLLQETNLQPLIHYRNGVYVREQGVIPARWTKGKATILIPCDPQAKTCSFSITIHSEKSLSRLSTNLSLAISGYKIIKKDTLRSHEVKQYEFSIPTEKLTKHFIYEVQNAGNIIFKSGFSRDRGAAVRPNYQIYEVDSPFYQQPATVPGFCGASVLIPKKTFMELGKFDEHFFMYYEDIDLSLRMKRQGYKIYYEPTSVLWHKHAASSKEWSKFFQFHVEKNHLALLIKHFPLMTAFREHFRYGLTTAILFLKMLRWRVLENWDAFDEQRVRLYVRLAVLGTIKNSFISLLKARYEITARQTVSLKEVINSLY